MAIYVPGTLAHGYEALTDCLFLYHVTEEYDAATPTSTDCAGPTAREAPLEHRGPILSERDAAACS